MTAWLEAQIEWVVAEMAQHSDGSQRHTFLDGMYEGYRLALAQAQKGL